MPAEWRTSEFWMRQSPAQSFELRREWEANKAREGYAGINWPKEYGGRGGTPTQKAIYDEEMARADAPVTVNTLGLTFLGPTVMAIGSDAQKRDIIKPMLHNEVIWCQGFSEPGAGSDLASPHHPGDRRGRPLGRQRAEGLDHQRAARRPDVRARAHRPAIAAPPRHLDAADRHARRRGRRPPAEADDRQRGVRRGLPHRREGSQGSRARRGRCRLERRDAAALVRARLVGDRAVHPLPRGVGSRSPRSPATPGAARTRHCASASPMRSSTSRRCACTPGTS